MLNELRRFNIAAVCFAVSLIALGRALQIKNGFYNPDALWWLTVALVACGIGVLLHRVAPALSRSSQVAVSVVLLAGIGWQLWQLFTARPGFYLHNDANLSVFRGGIVAQGICIVLGIANVRALRSLWFPALLAASVFLGAWMIKSTPDPYIDVVTVHKEALDALMRHQDPYRISFANIYERHESEQFYNPEAVIGGRLAQAYPYPPPSLLLVLPGHILLGDYRYSELALIIAAAALIGFSFRHKTAMLAAAAFLTTPRIWFVVEEGWSEPVGIFLLALTVAVASRWPVAAGWLSGILAVTKQYFGVAVLPFFRLMFLNPRRWMLATFGAAFLAAAVVLPFALWHPNAFMRNVIWLQTREPFRSDSLSYLAWAATRGLGRGSFIWAIGAGFLASAITTVSTRNTAAGFAASIAFTTFAFFAFGSKAFCNYYFFVIGALCCAIAAIPVDVDRPARRRPD